jgi:hypothetical protein
MGIPAIRSIHAPKLLGTRRRNLSLVSGSADLSRCLITLGLTVDNPGTVELFS